MKKRLAVVGVIGAVLALLGTTVYAFANVPANGSMGTWGYVASARDASLELAEAQPGATALDVACVSAPEPAWVVVHLDDNGMPGKRVGLLHVDKGITTGVSVKLADLTGSRVIVAVHADKGVPGRFDFDMEQKLTSPDRPFFVGGMELARVVDVK